MYADGPDVDYRYISDGDGNGATLSDGGQLSSYQRQQCSEAAAVVRLLGPRPAVESARVLLGVILQYMDRVRNIKEGDVAVRAKLQVRDGATVRCVDELQCQTGKGSDGVRPRLARQVLHVARVNALSLLGFAPPM